MTGSYPECDISEEEFIKSADERFIAAGTLYNVANLNSAFTSTSCSCARTKSRLS